MSGAIEKDPTANVELWTLYQWTCHDCPAVDGVPVAYGDADTLAAAQRAIIRHKAEAHREWDPAPTLPSGDVILTSEEAASALQWYDAHTDRLADTGTDPTAFDRALAARLEAVT